MFVFFGTGLLSAACICWHYVNLWGWRRWGVLADYLILIRTQLGVPSCLLGFVAVLVQDYDKVVALGFLQVSHAILCMSFRYYSYRRGWHTGVW
jgi:hypothetical protein